MINNLYFIRFILKSWVEWYTFYLKIIILTRVIGEIIIGNFSLLSNRVLVMYVIYVLFFSMQTCYLMLYWYYILFIEEGIINLGHTIVVFGNR